MKQKEIKTSDQIWQNIPAITELVDTADHVDVKVFDGAVTLREFLANALSYYPSWIKFLYRVRWLFVRALGMKQEGIPDMKPIPPEEFPFEPGDTASIFKIKATEEDYYYVTGATESHLTAHLAVVREPIDDTMSRYHLMTIVHYHRWTGPVYFNVIRPFHHLVVGQMGRAGLGGAA